MLKVQETEYCKLAVSFQADPSLVRSKKEMAVQELNKTKVQVPGFRPGKVSYQAMINYREKAVKELATRELVSEAYNQLIFQEKIKTFFYPNIKHVEFHKDDFWCELEALKKPEVTLKQYKDFEIPAPVVENVEHLVAKTLEDMRYLHGDSRPFDDGDVVAEKDKITIDVVATINDERVEGLCKEGFLHTVGQDFMPEFDQEILGMAPGESRVFSLKLDDKEVLFKVDFHMGMKTDPCPLDDSFAERLSFKTLDELMTNVQGSISRQVKNSYEEKLNQQLLSRLLENAEVTAPDFMVEMEATHAAQQRGAQWSSLDENTKQSLKTEAAKAVKLSLILDTIREVEPTCVFSDLEIISVLHQILESQGKTKTEIGSIIDHLKQNGSLVGIVANLKDKLVIDTLIKTCSIIQ